MSEKVSILIVSHSADVAKGTADMVKQMVGDQVKIAFCGGNSDGGLGTDVGIILETLKSVYSDAGVAVLVDLGGAETNSEMAIEMLENKDKVQICNAPLVEGAIMAAVEASSGATLEVVKATAEEFQS